MNKKHFIFQLIAVIILGTGFGSKLFAGSKGKKPNIILLLADDLGYSDLSLRGSDLYETPNIDKLASQSIIFTQAYASHPTCQPSRLAIQTGKYPARLKCVNHVYQQMPLNEVTIAEKLKEAGYKTCHIGKWHLGKTGCRPIDQGYDIEIASNMAGMPASYFYPFQNKETTVFNVPDLENGETGDYLTDKVTDKAVEFIQQNSDTPFFLNLCFYAVHTPIQAKEETVKKYKKKLSGDKLHTNPEYAAMIEHLDTNTGKIMDAVENTGIADNTIIIFFSDNGGLIDVTSNHPLRDGKGSLYEGGFKEPLFIKWAGVSEIGTVCQEPVIGHDLFPTILNMADIKTDYTKSNELDGIDISPLVQNPGGKIKRDELHWLYFPVPTHHFANANRKPGGAILKDGWKLIELMETPQGLVHHFELYNLKDDPGEQNDVSGSNPYIVAKLKADMIKWRNEVDAPEYDMSMYNK